ncbi:hypothetical protein V1279_005756 [Bradyrhizobium sp. AZCC 1610]
MFRRFWKGSNYWAETLSMDDSRGDYMVRLEDRVASLSGKLKVFGSSPEQRPIGTPNDRVHQLQS